MEPIRVTFKFKDKTKWSELTLMRALSKIGPLNCIGIFIGNTQVTFHLSEPTQITPFLTAKEELNRVKLELIESAEVKATRTIFIPRVQNFIANMDKDLLTQIIDDSNSNLEVENIIFVGSAISKTAIKNNLKIVFKTPDMAQLALQEGVWIDYFEIQASNIQPEEIIRPTQCNNCLKLDHETKDCRQRNQTCSRCTGMHNYNECDRKNPALCVNCGGPHSALYATCPEIKKQVNLIRKRKKNPLATEEDLHQGATAQPSQATTPPPPPPPPPPQTNAWFPNTANNNSIQQLHNPIPKPQRPQRVQTREVPKDTSSSSNVQASTPTTSTATPTLAFQADNSSTATPTQNYQASQQPPAFDISSIQLQYDAYKTFAEYASKGDPIQFLTLTNIFFKQAGLAFQVTINEEIKEALKTTSTETKANQTSNIQKETKASQTLISQASTKASTNSDSEYETDDESIDDNQVLSPLTPPSNMEKQATSTPIPKPIQEPSHSQENLSEKEEEEESLSQVANISQASKELSKNEEMENTVMENKDTSCEPNTTLESRSEASSSRHSSPKSSPNSQNTFGITPAQRPKKKKENSYTVNEFRKSPSVRPKNRKCKNRK